MAERGIEVDHSTLARWVFKFTPQLESEFRRKKKPIGNSWKWDEMTLKIEGKFYWLYRAVDSDGTIWSPRDRFLRLPSAQTPRLRP